MMNAASTSQATLSAASCKTLVRLTMGQRRVAELVLKLPPRCDAVGRFRVEDSVRGRAESAKVLVV
jgi:hypothetical protein